MSVLRASSTPRPLLLAVALLYFATGRVGMSRPIMRLMVVGAILIAAAAVGLLGESSVLVGRPALAQTNTPTAASGQIAFTSTRDGNYEIYVMNADGSGVTRLTNNSAYDFEPAWSPNGLRIAFRSRRDGNNEIYVMNADGSGVTRLTNNSAHNYEPAWSPDGRRIAFTSTRDGNYEIYVMNADGSGVTRLTNNPDSDDYPAWSPDGQRIAFTSSRDVYVMNADGSGVTRLTNNSAYDYEPAWSPGGQRIAFQRYHGDGNNEIYVMNADGSAVTRLTNNPASDGEPAWSPDSLSIAFTSSRDGNLEIYVLGGVTTRLTNNPASDLTPAWSYPDGRILEIFYHATGGANWTNNTNWLSDRPLEEWHGVTTRWGRVTKLQLHGNNLTGSIPPELGSLSYLTDLNLDGNRLSGSIPPELGSLPYLTGLHLGNNELSEIPPELGSLSRLTTLRLHNNRLSGSIPPELGSLSSLTWLEFDNNRLSGSIPPELGSLSNLKELHLVDNRLSGSIPPELGSLPYLTALNLGGNRLTGSLPLSLTGLTRLQRFEFTGNDWLCAPTDAAFQQWLQAIPNRDDGPNCSDGNILVAFYRVTGGANWTNNTNWLSDRPLGEWHGVTTDEEGRVTGLGLESNNLTGTIPPELGSLTNLASLNLAANQLTGPLPRSLTGLTELESFGFADNAGLCAPTDGTFQDWLQAVSDADGPDCTDRNILIALYNATGGANWTNNANWLSDRPLGEWHGVTTDDEGRVTELRLESNNLKGKIPLLLGTLSNLTTLGLGENNLSGTIPPELGSLTNLTVLSLWGNELSGEIPPELGSLSSLRALNLWGNELSGRIPPELGSLSNLTQLNLSVNQLGGRIPPELGSLTNLTALYLNINSLTGALPLSLTRLTALDVLWFNNNSWGRLCAPRDAAFQQWLQAVPHRNGPTCTDRHILAFLFMDTGRAGWTNYWNWLSDRPLGEWHGVTTDAQGRVTELRLGDNNLRGTIPPELGSLTNLTALSLWGNQLSGSIPPELGSLARLEDLNVGSNQLSGSIPPELGSLTNLTSLRLGINQLSGSIPTELGGLARLQYLHLRNNRLTGSVPAELGSLANLRSLALERNRLTGSLPLSLTGLTGLESFGFTGNDWLCAPTDGAFQQWLQAIPNRDGGLNCISYDSDDDGLIEVSTLAQLDAIRWDLDGNGSASDSGYDRAFPAAAPGMGCPSAGCIGYELIADLDFDTDDSGWASAGDAYWNEGAGWTPIGRGGGSGFSAVFEGNGRAIDSLYVKTTDENAGLFSVIAEGGTVRNVRLESVNVSGRAQVGGLAGQSSGTISDVRVTGTVTGRNAVGGLVGASGATGVIGDSHAAASVTGTTQRSDGGRDVGGLVGVNRGEVRGSYATGSVSGRANNTGGLIGILEVDSSIVASYASGPVSSGGSYVGGLVGSSWGDVTASYAVGSVVAGGGNAGGLVGHRGAGTVTASYWDRETSGQARSPAGQGKTTAELQGPTGYTGIYAGWNVDIDGDGNADDPWDFGTSSEYPTLR